LSKRFSVFFIRNAGATLADGARDDKRQLGVFVILEFSRCADYLLAVSTLQDIKKAVQNLSLEERAEFAKWFNGWEDDDWDKQMKRDVSRGKLGKLLRQVDADIAAGRLTEFPFGGHPS
jgi:hypothetical protein